ncbi:cupin domain-containing protein [Acidovorax sp. LjRoot194]|uniref:cupin domain-containing protein n=1 Tax=Acidovorax sp. LjRoot194 TaxID=3342280 RepID=UPI003ED09200
MTRNLVTFSLNNLGDPREYGPPADRVLEGDIVVRNWDIDSAKDGAVRAGVFESTPGTNRSIKGDTWEFCYILSGEAEITEDGHAPITFRAGDCFIMKPGYTGTWKTLETVRKVWVVAST